MNNVDKIIKVLVKNNRAMTARELSEFVDLKPKSIGSILKSEPRIKKTIRKERILPGTRKIFEYEVVNQDVTDTDVIFSG